MNLTLLTSSYFLNATERDKVDVDTERYVDLQLMVQRRFDAPGRTRAVKREQLSRSDIFIQIDISIHPDYTHYGQINSWNFIVG